MAANDRLENRAVENRARSGGARRSIPGSIPWPEPRPLPWPGNGHGTRWSADWWRAQFGSPARIREWAAQELTTGRLLPWFAVAYGTGVVLYFTAEREPALWAAVVPVVVCALGAVLLRRQIVPQKIVLNVIALGLFGIALGFAVATLKTSLIQHPVLRFPASGVTISGFVELREESQHTDRFVLRVDRIDGGRIEEPPRRVRLSVKRGMAPAPGSFVEVKASLDPPLQPLEPGSYDFERDLFFQGIGASGFVRGAVKVIVAPAPQGVLARADAFVQRLRDAIDARIRAVLPGDEGAIAAMLINGRRDAIAPNVYDALFVSGIGHVLSISGYHMAVVAGVIFFIVRVFFALIPGLADRAPIKKWAALAALLVTGFYLILSGNQVATQRSFIMIGVVLVGVLFDRPALTMRTLTIAALVVLLFAPESIVHPSFQMSFAPTLALIAGYERGAIKLRGRADTSLGARAALWGVNEIVGLTIASFRARMARGRCGRSRRARSKPGAGDRLRCVRLHRQARRRRAGRLRAHPGGLRRRLHPRCARGGKPRRSAGGLQGDRHRPSGVAATRRAHAEPPRRRFHY
ncbi:MAG TPA: ComEC/Rec2 family competence protein [Xanthobacteraceae bacterium]|nr:ComEC/Rec2 family competence protein [Xanthobacteraceae bacterium]